MRKFLVFLLFFGLALQTSVQPLTAQGKRAQDEAAEEEKAPRNLQKAFTLSIASFDAIVLKLDRLLEAAGRTDLQIALQTTLAEKGPPQGLDTTKPVLGLLVEADPQGIAVKGFMPITDVSDLLRSPPFRDLNLPTPRWDQEGVASYPLSPDLTLFLHQRETGLFFATGRQALLAMDDGFASSVSSLLGGFVMAAQLDVPPIMEWYEKFAKEQYVMQMHLMKQMFPGLMGEDESPEGGDEAGEEQRAGGQGEGRPGGRPGQGRPGGRRPGGPGANGEVADQLEISEEDRAALLAEYETSPQARQVELLKQMKMVALRIGVDDSTGAIVLDGVSTAAEGTELAAMAAEMADAKSDLAGFYFSDAAVSLQMSMPINEASVARHKESVDGMVNALSMLFMLQGKSEEELEPVQEFINSLADVAKSTIDGRRFDMGVSLLAPDPSMVAIIAGLRVGDPVTLERLFRQNIGQANPMIRSLLTLNAETFEGIRMHTIAIPTGVLPLGDSAPALREGMTGVVGFSEEMVYLAVGTGAMEALKDAIRQSKAELNKPVPTTQLSISMDAIGNALEGFGPLAQTDVTAPFVELLRNLSPKSRISLRTVGVKPASQRMQLKIDAELLVVMGTSLLGNLPGGERFSPLVKQQYEEEYEEEEYYEDEEEEEDEEDYEEEEEDYYEEDDY